MRRPLKRFSGIAVRVSPYNEMSWGPTEVLGDRDVEQWVLYQQGCGPKQKLYVLVSLLGYALGEDSSRP